MEDTVFDAWENKRARKDVCERYYSAMCATKTDAEIMKTWRDLGISYSTCYNYLRRFKMKRSAQSSNGSFQLNRRIMMDFCAKHYHFMSSSLSDVEIKEQWLKWGVQEKICQKFLKNFKENDGWKKNLLSGKLDIFATGSRRKSLLLKADEKRICKEIFLHKRAEISNTEIRKVFESLGISINKFYAYLKDFKKPSLIRNSGKSGKSPSQLSDDDDSKSTSSNETSKSILDSNEDSQSRDSVSSRSLEAHGISKRRFEIVQAEIPIEPYKNLQIINGYLRKCSYKRRKLNR